MLNFGGVYLLQVMSTENRSATQKPLKTAHRFGQIMESFPWKSWQVLNHQENWCQRSRRFSCELLESSWISAWQQNHLPWETHVSFIFRGVCYDPYIEGLKFLHFSMGFSGSKGWLQEGDSFRCSTNAWTVGSWTRKVKPSNRGSSRDGALVDSFLMESMTTLPWNMSRKKHGTRMQKNVCLWSTPAIKGDGI